MAIVDTDFLSSLFKINKLKLILETLNLKYLTIPSTVYEEIKSTQFFREILCLLAFKKEDLDKEKYILVKDINIENDLTKFFNANITEILGKGELGCFILAKRTKDIILINDRQARKIAKENDLKAISLPTFLLHCKRKNILSLNEIHQIIKDLKEKDYYEFNEEVKEVLLE